MILSPRIEANAFQTCIIHFYRPLKLNGFLNLHDGRVNITYAKSCFNDTLSRLFKKKIIIIIK